MWTIIVRTVIQIAAGLGIGELLDKFIKPQVPVVYYPEPVGLGFRVPRLVWIIISFVIAVLALKFIGRKFKISILK